MIFDRARRNAIQIEGERSSVIGLARGRLMVMRFSFIGLYILLAARAFDIGFIQSYGEIDLTVRHNEKIQATERKSAAGRGEITDRNGILLATTIPSISLYADPFLIADKTQTAMALVKIFPSLSSDELIRRWNGPRRFARLIRDITPDQQKEILMIGEPGLKFVDETRRVYPQGPLTSHIVGYAGLDNNGLAGIERGLNRNLSNKENIKLSIDIRVQHVLKREIEKSMREFRATGAAGVIMDAESGEVLAGISLPDFDPMQAGSAAPEKIFNRLTLGVYELGSVFKIFSTAAYLEKTRAAMSSTFDARKPLEIDGFDINDFHAQKRIMTLPEVFMHSSNIGTAMMAQSLGGGALHDFYDDLGLTKPMDFEINETGRPRTPAPWRAIHTVTASYGHGLTTTPLQIAAATASIINGGAIVKPTMLAQESAPRPGPRIVSEKTSAAIRALMRLVVTDGTGKNADVGGYAVGGKTGTADKNAGGRYDRERRISSFVGAFPINAPRYVIYVMIDEPKPSRRSKGYATAGWVAAPVVARVVSSMATILDIPPVESIKTKPVPSPLLKYVSVVPHE